jgi:hypothetical protein
MTASVDSVSSETAVKKRVISVAEHVWQASLIKAAFD